jgi:hypothetical protein
LEERASGDKLAEKAPMVRIAIAFLLPLLAAGCGDDDYGHERASQDMAAAVVDLTGADTAAPLDLTPPPDLSPADHPADGAPATDGALDATAD